MAGGLGTGLFSCSPLIPALALVSAGRDSGGLYPASPAVYVAGASAVEASLFTKPGGETHDAVTATPDFYYTKEGLGNTAIQAACTTPPSIDIHTKDRGIGRFSYVASNTAAWSSQARSVTSR